MARLLGREALFVFLSVFYAARVVPLLVGFQPALALAWVGAMMTLSFMAIYALTVLATSRLRPATRGWLGLAAWGLAFGSVFMDVVDGFITPAIFLPIGFSLLPALLAALRAPGGRLLAAGDALAAFSLPMAGIRWLLLPLVAGFPPLAAMVLHTAGLYLLLRTCARVLWPLAAEGEPNAAPLLFRPVPDHIVGLVEGSTGRRARPYATRVDGSRDERAISLLCPGQEAVGVAATLNRTLAHHPFAAEVGEPVGDEVEVVVRPSAPPLG